MTAIEKNNDKTPAAKSTHFVAPRVDIHELGDALVIAAEVPGVARDGVDIQIDGGTLVVTATRTDVSYGKPLFSARTPTAYKRSFQLPDTVDPDKIEAKLDRGVLEVTLPKRESLKPKRIEVRGS